MTTTNLFDPTPAKIKILVVEDVSNVATVLEARLESFGYEVCYVAKSGPQAIECAMAHQPDIILMDIMLEGEMNGIQAAKQINRKLDTPIIYLSCLNDQAVVDSAMETNPYGFIVKPYDNAELRFSIENALKKYYDLKHQKARIAELETIQNGKPKR